MGQKGAWPRSRDLFFKFWDSPNISGMAEDTNLKFCMQIDGKKGILNQKMKNGSKGGVV